MKLDLKAAANTLALTWGLGLFLMTWWLMAWEGASQDPIFLSKFYIGYRVSPLGSVIGLAWALLDGWIAGAVLAWLYNSFARSSNAP
jgi:hypothetical protein